MRQVAYIAAFSLGLGMAPTLAGVGAIDLGGLDRHAVRPSIQTAGQDLPVVQTPAPTEGRSVAVPFWWSPQDAKAVHRP